MILVDTNVFGIDLRYRRDPLFERNRRFLDRLAQGRSGGTTVFNLLELAGILSFNLSARQLREFLLYFPRKYRVRVVPSFDLAENLPSMRLNSLVDRIEGRLSLGDSLVLEAAERHAPAGSRFVTWDAAHFRGRSRLDVRTPEEMLDSWTG